MQEDRGHTNEDLKEDAKEEFEKIKLQLRGFHQFGPNNEKNCKQLFPLFRLGFYASSTSPPITPQKWDDPVCPT